MRQEVAKEGGCCQGLNISLGFSATSGKTLLAIDLQCNFHMPWPQSPLSQAQLDALSYIRPITWFCPIGSWPRRRITALQMGVTQVWWHKSLRAMPNVNCITQSVTWEPVPQQDGLLLATHHRLTWFVSLPWTSLLLLMVLLTVGTFHLVTAFLFLAYIMPVCLVARSPCFFRLYYLRPWLKSSCQPTIYFLISWSCLQLYLSMVACLPFLYELLPNKARTAAFCYNFVKRSDGYQICLIMRLLQALLPSLLGAANLVIMFLYIVIVLLGCSIKWSRLLVLLPIFSVLMGGWIVIF